MYVELGSFKRKCAKRQAEPSKEDVQPSRLRVQILLHHRLLKGY